MFPWFAPQHSEVAWEVIEAALWRREFNQRNGKVIESILEYHYDLGQDDEDLIEILR